jgi:uncharacterized membrane protein
MMLMMMRSMGGDHFRRRSFPPSRRALDILEERFAKGEIERDEFEQRRHTIEAGEQFPIRHAPRSS